MGSSTDVFKSPSVRRSAQGGRRCRGTPSAAASMPTCSPVYRPYLDFAWKPSSRAAFAWRRPRLGPYARVA